MTELLDPYRSVSVSASAGSGKTWQLVSRITRLLLEGANPGAILALTFTRKAAAEMRERVEARLRLLALAADDTALDSLLAPLGVSTTPAIRARARTLYESVLFGAWPLRATTLHAFCQDLVARFPEQTGLAPGFEIADNEPELLECAWQRLQKRLLADPQADETQAFDSLIAEGFGEFALHRCVIQFLYRRGDWWAYTRQQENPLAFAEARLREQLAIESETPHAVLADTTFDTLLHRFYGLLERVGNAGTLRAKDVFPALSATSANRFEMLRKALLTRGNEPRSLKQTKKLNDALGADVNTLLADFATITERLIHVDDQCRRLATLRRSVAGLTLGVAALEELDAECRARHQVCFTELEWLAVSLLTDANEGHWVQYKLDQRVDHLLLDEFQDTSGTQWQLLRPLLEEMAAGDAGRLRSAFVVGDIKQSIYGFRRANPELLPQAAQWITDHLDGITATLAQSHRSAPAVIEWINALFAAPDLLRDFPLHSTVRQGWGRVERAAAVAPDVRDGDAPVAFRNALTTPRADPENTRALREGRLIAERIRALVDARWPVSDAAHTRALDYGDILILLRQRTHAQALEQALAEAGIPFVGAASGTLLHTAEAQDLLALLRFLQSPSNALALAHALRSPIFGASDADLAALAMQARTTDGHWFAALGVMTRSATLERAHGLLGRWIEGARRLPVHDLLDRICSEGNLAARYAAALPAAQAGRARGNLNAMIQLALEMDSGRYPSLSRFVEQLERRAQEQDAPDETPPPAAARQVRVLTVHAAKGLEAPAVFVAQCATRPQAKTAGWLVEWPAQASAPTHFLLAPSQEEQDRPTRELLALRQQRERIEDLNLLYVAVTRAQRFLFLSGFLPRHAASDSWHALAGAAFDRLGIESVDGLQVYARGALGTAHAARPADPALADDPRLRQPLRRSRMPAAAGDTPLDAAAARRGQAIHWLIQQLSAGRDDALRGRLEAQLTGPLSDHDFRDWRTTALTVCQAPALRRFFDPAQFRQAWNEIPLLHEGTTGVIDRLVDDGDSLWVLDYKTQPGGDDAALLALHRAQLERYRDGVRRLWPQRRVRAGLVRTDRACWLELPD